MAEIRKKFNIGRFTLKNALLLVLLMVVTIIISAVGKLVRFQISDINIAQAQNCWTQSSYSSCSGCGSGGASSCYDASCRPDPAHDCSYNCVAYGQGPSGSNCSCGYNCI